MKFSELANYCEEIQCDCLGCEHEDECERFSSKLESISPLGLKAFVEGDEDI